MAREEKVGTVTDFYAQIGVAAIRLTAGDLRVGDRVRIAGEVGVGSSYEGKLARGHDEADALILGEEDDDVADGESFAGHNDVHAFRRPENCPFLAGHGTHGVAPGPPRH